MRRRPRAASPRPEVLVVGSGTRFISGVSHYTRYLAVALSARGPVSVILMRRLIPRRLYPGAARVGLRLTEEAYPPGLPVFDGIDWYWMPSMLGALRFLFRRRPGAIVLQWWTGAVLHSYLLLALVARVVGAPIIIELHELQDSGEADIGLARRYVKRFGALLMGAADGFLVHSDFDRDRVERGPAAGGRPVRVMRHGPFSHYATAVEPLREAPAAACNFLFFGTIRPYKGLEDLVRAFELLAEEDPGLHWLTVVGETWEGWREPTDLIARSPHRERITLVNRYVTDGEAGRWFAGADVAVLPYRRSSASGPLHMSTAAGMPVVTTDVGGLRDGVGDYAGALLVPPADVAELAGAMRRARGMRGRRFQDNGSWELAADTVLGLVDELRRDR